MGTRWSTSLFRQRSWRSDQPVAGSHRRGIRNPYRPSRSGDAPSPFVAHITISADGTRIAYSSIQRSRNIQKLPIDPANGTPRGEPTWITTGSRLWANPDPSPDGKWVVFYSSVHPEGDLYVARSDGTGLRQLTSGADPIDRMPRWSPDGQWIAFHSIRGKDQYLWKIRPDGSDLQQLSPLADAIYPVWSPDGSRMAILMGAGIGHPENNVYVFDPTRPWNDQTPDVIAAPADSPDEFVVNSWSPDGSRLAGQAGLAARGIVTYSLPSQTFERLTDFGGYPVWLPDSRRCDVRGGWAGLPCRRYTIPQGRESLLSPARRHRTAAVDEGRTRGLFHAARHRGRYLAPDAVSITTHAVTAWRAFARLSPDRRRVAATPTR